MDIATDITRRYMTLSLTVLNSDVTFTLVGVNGTSQKGGGHMSELLTYLLLRETGCGPVGLISVVFVICQLFNFLC